jgi:spore germination cell wall hydrolase CwlJ-like protein
VSGDLDALARTLWGEARGEGRRGIEAVAAVVMNRLAAGRWGATAEAVCRARKQFSCWNPGDPNRPKLERVDARDAAFALCLEAAADALAGRLADPTGGATHYHARGRRPWWARGLAPCAEIGAHVFYRGVD